MSIEARMVLRIEDTTSTESSEWEVTWVQLITTGAWIGYKVAGEKLRAFFSTIYEEVL